VTVLLFILFGFIISYKYIQNIKNTFLLFPFIKVNMSSSTYASLGVANPLTPDDIDPVYMCVGNTFFNKVGTPGSNLQEDFCPRFMAQRCASNFDNMCEAYLTDSKYDSGGFLHLNKKFLADTAKQKYCRMASGAPGSHCAKKCESFLPEGQSSVQICENIGTQNWLDTKNEYDLAGNFPQSARLNPISPLYLGPCPETCDAMNPSYTDSLGPDDMVLNKCIEHGACSNILMDLAYNTVKNNTPVTNEAFKKIIEYSKIDKDINPNIASMIARSHGIPQQVALDVLELAKYGTPSTMQNVSSSVYSKGVVSPVTHGVVSPVTHGVVSPVTHGVVSPITNSIDGKEGYYTNEQKKRKNNADNKVIWVVMAYVMFIIIVLIVFLLNLK
jgi:hypothetical protein